MTTTTPDPISTTQERVLVRSTATGFEQAIAGVAGLFTAGPLGALAAWGALRGLQGKWAPWFILGIPSAIVLNLVQLTLLAAIMSVGEPAPEERSPWQEAHHVTTTEQVTNI